jgi:hypothetical protein
MDKLKAAAWEGERRVDPPPAPTGFDQLNEQISYVRCNIIDCTNEAGLRMLRDFNFED